MSTNATTTFGVLLKKGATSIGEVVSVDGMEITQEAIEATFHQASPANFREFVTSGLKSFSEFNGDVLVTAVTSLTFSANSTKHASSAGTKVFSGSFDVLYDPAAPPAPLAVVGGTAQIAIGYGVSIDTTGGQGQLTLSYSGFTVANGVVTSAPCSNNANGVAMGTITATDECGDSVSWDVRLPGGTWIETGWTYFDCTGLQGYYWEPCISSPCQSHYAMDTSCKTYFTGDTFTYLATEEDLGSIRNTASWGEFYSLGTGLYYPTTNPAYYGGDRGTAPPTPTFSSCTGQCRIVPVIQRSYKWVCP